jgi:hypothetical protein
LGISITGCINCSPRPVARRDERPADQESRPTLRNLCGSRRAAGERRRPGRPPLQRSALGRYSRGYSRGRLRAALNSL